MKKLIALASVAVLAACSPAETEAPVVEETVAAVEAMPGSVTPGTYNVSRDDGTTSVFTLNEDGSFTSVTGDETANGTSAVVDGKICFTGSEEGAEAECWTNSEVAADGSFSSVSDGGATVQVAFAEAAAE